MSKTGTALLFTVSMIFLLTIAIAIGLSLVFSRATKTRHSRDYAQCLLLADTGVERARYRVKYGPAPVVGAPENITFAGGNINVAFTAIAPTFNATITATFPSPTPRSTITTTIRLDGSANFVTPPPSYTISGG